MSRDLVAVALFVSLFIAFFLLCVPLGEDVTPAALAVEAVKRRVGGYFVSGDKEELLRIIGRSVGDVARTGVAVGAGLGLIGLLVSFRFIGAFSAILFVGLLILGIVVVDRVMQNEFRQWQGRLFDGIPPLVNFMPAFLEIESVTPREALAHAIPFLPEPLKSEMWTVVDRIRRTGRVREAMDSLASRAKHPLVDAVCFRLSAAWDAKITADIFADLGDQIEDLEALSISRATAAKTGYLALISVLGMLGMMLLFGYPGWQYLMNQLTEGFLF